MKGESVIADTAMYPQIARLPDHISFALNTMVFNVRPTPKVAVCGMGSCAIAGEIVSDYMDGMGRNALPVIKGIDLPKWVDSDTTVIAISYSGNTHETLHLYRNAVRRGCQVVCVTSGGELEDLCIRDGNVIFSIPGGFQSRGALGYMVGFILVILKAIGHIDSLKDVEDALPVLREYTQRYMNGDDNEAYEIAKGCKGRIPVIYSFFNMRSAACRWKSQINENSKMLSFSGTIPEFNHNELVGWTGDSVNEKFYPIVLLDDGASQMLKYMAETPIGMLMDSGTEVYVHHISGKNILEKTLKAIITGDFVSLYLAYLRGVDPVSDEQVDKTKGMVNSSVSRHR